MLSAPVIQYFLIEVGTLSLSSSKFDILLLCNTSLNTNVKCKSIDVTLVGGNCLDSLLPFPPFFLSFLLSFF